MQNLNSGTINKPKATLDEENNRYIIRPVDGSATVSVRMVLRAIKETTHTNWRHLADWCALKKQSDVFKLTYSGGNKKLRDKLAQYITVAGDVAYFYDSEHKPANVEAPIIHPTVVNNENDIITVTAKIPELVTSRIVIKDQIERSLELSVSVPTGYLISNGHMPIATPGTTIVRRGTAKRLNEFLKTLKYTSTEFGEQEIVVTVNDLTGVSAGIITTSVLIEVVAGKTVTVPTITVPEQVTLEEEGDTTLPAIKVTDEANQLLTLRMTPYGCEVYDIKNYIGYVTDGELYTTKGTATSLTDSLKAVKVRTENDEAQILIELVVSGVAHLRNVITLSAETESSGVGGSVGGTTAGTDNNNNTATADTATTDSTVLGE